MFNKFKIFASQLKNNSFLTYEWSSKVVKRGNQLFAVFGSIAYDVTKTKFTEEGCSLGDGKLCVPINGRYLAEFPDEGSSGIMGMYIITRNGRRAVLNPSFVPCGWIYTEELELNREQIRENIINDVLDGKNVFTNPPAG